MKKMRVYLSFVLLVVLVACTEKKAPESIQQTPALPSPQPLAQKSPKNTSPDVSKKDDKDHTTKDPKDSTPEPKDHEAPCCHESSEVLFQGLDVHGKLIGLDTEMDSSKEYQAKLSIVGNTESLENYTLQVRAGMSGMKHQIEFPTERISAREYKIDPVVFSMPGKWDISLAFLNQGEEPVDTCTCKKIVK